MNKRELIDFVCANLETTKTGAEETVNTVLRGIQHGIAEEAVTCRLLFVDEGISVALEG